MKRIILTAASVLALTAGAAFAQTSSPGGTTGTMGGNSYSSPSTAGSSDQSGAMSKCADKDKTAASPDTSTATGSASSSDCTNGGSGSSSVPTPSSANPPGGASNGSMGAGAASGH
jgi:hypothetical protein